MTELALYTEPLHFSALPPSQLNNNHAKQSWTSIKNFHFIMNLSISSIWKCRILCAGAHVKNLVIKLSLTRNNPKSP